MPRALRSAWFASFSMLVGLAACVADDEGSSSTAEFGDEFVDDDFAGEDETGTSEGDSSTSGESESDTSTSSTTDTDADEDTTTTTDDGETGNPGNPYDDAAQYCVDVINMYRATLDLPPYERWIEAEVCSGEEAQSDAMTQTPHGAFGQCGEWAQNECPGWPGPPEQLLDGCLAAMWAEGPGEPFSEHGHYINMSSTQYTKVACGFYQTQQGDYWAIQNFQ